MKKFGLIVVAALLSTGCSQKSHIDQSEICVYSDEEEAKECKAGELAWFKPDMWGNDQLPLSAAAYCDFNYDVMYNNSGVICVFTDERIE